MFNAIHVAQRQSQITSLMLCVSPRTKCTYCMVMACGILWFSHCYLAMPCLQTLHRYHDRHRCHDNLGPVQLFEKWKKGQSDSRKRTSARTNYLISQGYTVVEMWECTYTNTTFRLMDIMDEVDHK